MGVRRATTNDTKTLVEFLNEYHTKSNLADIPFDKQSMTSVIDYYIGMPKHVVLVYEDGDRNLTGVLAGNIEQFMFNKKKTWATDLLFVSNSGGAWLLRKFKEWARLQKAERIFMGVSSGNERSDALYKAEGLQPTGGMYVMALSQG